MNKRTIKQIQTKLDKGQVVWLSVRDNGGQFRYRRLKVGNFPLYKNNWDGFFISGCCWFKADQSDFSSVYLPFMLQYDRQCGYKAKLLKRKPRKWK
jgi:hypothetical protein